MISNSSTGGRSISTFRRTNDSECYYTSTEPVGTITQTAFLANVLYSMIFFTGSNQRTVDIIAIRCITLGTALNARLGIYLDNGNIYPGTLLLDAGTVDISTTGVKTIAVNQVLPKNTIIFGAVVMNGTSTLRCFSALTHPLGKGSILGLGYNSYHSNAFIYAALPDPFPTSAPTLSTSEPPAIYFRFSS